MEYQTEFLAALAIVDSKLDELKEDFGDLPEQVQKKQNAYEAAQKLADETKAILDEIKKFVSVAKVTLVELKDKEEKLVQQQFNVRNNKEFDAITNEIAHIKEEHSKLSDKMRSEGMKQENLTLILESQMAEAQKAKEVYEQTKSEVEYLTGEQNDELKQLNKKRDKILKKISKLYVSDYNRIRTMHTDAAVKIKRNSCAGCFSAIPAQLIVEVRNNIEKVFFCENCGRMLLPEETPVTEEDVAKL